MKHYWKIDRVRNISSTNLIEHITFLRQYDGRLYVDLNSLADNFYNKPAGSGYFGRIVTQFNILGLYRKNQDGSYNISEVSELIAQNNDLAPIYLEYFLVKFQFPRPHLHDTVPISKPFLIILKLLIELYEIDTQQSFLTKPEFHHLFNEGNGTFDINTIDRSFANQIIANGRNWAAGFIDPSTTSNDLTYDKALLVNSNIITSEQILYPLAQNFYIGLSQSSGSYEYAKYILNKYTTKEFTYNTSASTQQLNLIKSDWSRYIGNKRDFTQYINEKNMITQLDPFKNYCEDKGFYFEEELIRRFITSLIAKPFLLLTGISGTGKSKIAELFGEYLKEIDKGSYELVAVESNWNDQKKLIGYWNPIVGGGSYDKTEIVKFIEDANATLNKIHIIILDEMNLSYTERYFSAFLSALESITKEIKLPDGTTIRWSENLKIIGTINEDETTHTLSPKVIDRSNVIEMNGADPKTYFDSLILRNDNKVTDLIGMAWKDDYIILFKGVYDACMGRFGYRIMDEVTQYVIINFNIKGGDFKTYFDEQIYQKILPKIHGSRGEVKDVLENLNALFKEKSLNKSEEKAIKMLQQLSSTGFTSFVSAW